MRLILRIVLVACQLTAVTAQVQHILPWSPGEISPLRVTKSKALPNEQDLKGTSAIDRNLMTKSGTEAVNGEVWFKVEYGKSHFIYKIVIYHVFFNADFYKTYEWCVKTMDNYRTCKDKNNNVDVSVYQGEEHQKSCGTLQMSYGLELSDQTYTFFCDVEGDSILLSKKTLRISISEIVVTSSQGE